jgi:bacterial/archaeal transporter family protein
LFDFLNANVAALIAAFFIASARTLYRGALSTFSPATTTLFSLLVTAIIAWCYYFLTGRVENWPLMGVFWFAVVGFSSSFVARYLSFISINLVGLARGSIIIQTSLIWSAMFAVFILGEEFSWEVGAGTLFIMIGSILLVSEGSKVQKSISLHYYLVPVAVAFFLALSHFFLKLGFFWLPSASVGMVVSTSTALLLMLLVLPFTNEGIPRSLKLRPIFIVVLGGISNALAAVFFLSAVKNGRLVEVIPINRISVMIIIFFSWVFFRNQEAISIRVVTGGILSVLGAWLIVS